MIRETKKNKKKKHAQGDDEEEDDPDDEPELAEDLRRMNALIDKSILLENEITELLPEVAAKVLQRDLRAFLHQVICSRDHEKGGHKDLRAELDNLIFGAL